jgi:hypothetical protein
MAIICFEKFKAYYRLLVFLCSEFVTCLKQIRITNLKMNFYLQKVNKNNNMSELSDKKYDSIKEEFTIKGCTLVKFTKKSINLEYICKCGEIRIQLYKDFKRRQCRTCRDKKLLEKPDYNLESKNGEIWKPITGGWISNFGNAKNSLEKELNLCPTKYRYHIAGKHQYASRLVAEAFQIDNYEKLEDKKFIVIHIDGDASNNKLDNIKIGTKSETNSINGAKSHKSSSFTEKVLLTQDTFKDFKNVVIKELPKHIIYSNGEIWNGTRFLIFSKNDTYLNLCLKDKVYKVHRIICYAFNPIEGKENLSDYDELQVNHKDGNTLNNNSENLEWVSSSKNMFHAYSTKLNKKTRNVLQYTLEGNFVKEYISIAEASRESKEPEHRIRTLCQGKTNSKALFKWEFKNNEETSEYTKKYSSK